MRENPIKTAKTKARVSKKRLTRAFSVIQYYADERIS